MPDDGYAHFSVAVNSDSGWTKKSQQKNLTSVFQSVSARGLTYTEYQHRESPGVACNKRMKSICLSGFFIQQKNISQKNLLTIIIKTEKRWVR